MDHRSKDLLWFIAIILVLVIIATAHRTFVRKDYFVTTEIPCEAETERCFQFTSVCEEGTNDCVPEASTYKVIRMKAYTLYGMCGSIVAECALTGCAEGDSDCSLMYCDDERAALFGECVK